jgi:hypothetical protein
VGSRWGVLLWVVAALEIILVRRAFARGFLSTKPDAPRDALASVAALR